MTKKTVRVRIAPSPTGYFHIGTARTALFNWLFAKQHNGTFILRIEDTDKERSKKEFEQDIIEQLAWLGLDYDEGPIRQSERTKEYRRYLEQLLAEKKAYYCFCTKDELENMRQSATSAGKPAVYNGRCRSLTTDEVEKRHKAGEASVIRFKMPAGKNTFEDLIRGKVTFDNTLIGDIVIAKNLDNALYNFTVVIDDADMEISHVIRGEDHLGNTPKQLALIEALGFAKPLYAHIPLILNPDRSKMSKRAGDTAIREYREAGYLPDALVNFLALLGWHPTDEQELFGRDDLVRAFDVRRIQKGGAAFTIDKLDWFNAAYIKKMPIQELYTHLKAFGALDAVAGLTKEQIEKIIVLLQERLKRLSDFSEAATIFAETASYTAPLLVWKKSTSQHAIENLEAVKTALESVKHFTKTTIEAALNPLAETKGRGEVLWPLRVALSGLEASPGPYELLEILGKDESLRRIEAALKKFNGRRSPFKE